MSNFNGYKSKHSSQIYNNKKKFSFQTTGIIITGIINKKFKIF